MKDRAEPRPRARQQGLIVQDLPEEVLVYDLDRYKAHCLSPASAAIWRLCDGTRTVAEIARRLKNRTKPEEDEAVVWVALRRLSRARLLEEKVALPPTLASPSRRAWLKKAAGLSAIMVATITVPTAAFAASCIDGMVCCQARQSHGTCPETRPCCTSNLPCASQANGQFCSCGGTGGCT